jgi:hypothetical protein
MVALSHYLRSLASISRITPFSLITIFRPNCFFNAFSFSEESFMPSRMSFLNLVISIFFIAGIF